MASTSSNTETRSFTGSCHCGAVKYTVDLPINILTDPPKITRCNCTMCLKTGWSGIDLPPNADLQKISPALHLISPATIEEIADYQATRKTIHRRFCDKCGIHVIGHGSFEHEGQVFPFSKLNVGTLDQPQEGLDLSKWRHVEYWDGQSDGWMKGPQQKPWEGGLI